MRGVFFWHKTTVEGSSKPYSVTAASPSKLLPYRPQWRETRYIQFGRDKLRIQRKNGTRLASKGERTCMLLSIMLRQ